MLLLLLLLLACRRLAGVVLLHKHGLISSATAWDSDGRAPLRPSAAGHAQSRRVVEPQ